MIYGRGTPLNKIAPKVPILKGQRLPFIPLQLWGNMKKGLVYPRKVPLTLNPTQMTLTGVSLGMGGAWMPIMTRMLPPGTTHSTATCRFLDIFSTTSDLKHHFFPAFVKNIALPKEISSGDAKDAHDLSSLLRPTTNSSAKNCHPRLITTALYR